MATVEEAAASMSRHFLSVVGDDSELSGLAERAYVSFLRSYASFSGPMREHFTFKKLHLGHVARAFCLRDAPSDVAARVTGKHRHPPDPDGKSKPEDAGLTPSKKLVVFVIVSLHACAANQRIIRFCCYKMTDDF